jgi:hypothetical protein
MRPTVVLFTLALGALAARPAAAHCDTMDGPVVRTAQQALESDALEPVLAWVQPADEAEIRQAHAEALAVRRLGPQARALADRSFLETVVRVHRAGEGAPYTGLKPAGSVQDPSVIAADAAVASGRLDALTRVLEQDVLGGLRQRYTELRAQRPPTSDVAAGRRWVAADVRFMHYVEGVHRAAAPPAAEPAHARAPAARAHADAPAAAHAAHHGH